MIMYWYYKIQLKYYVPLITTNRLILAPARDGWQEEDSH